MKRRGVLGRVVAAVATAVGATTIAAAPPVSADSAGAFPGTARGAAAVIAAGAEHTCAIVAGGDVMCWGNNQYGQLGQGHSDDIGGAAGQMGDNLLPIELGAPAIEVTAAAAHTCALLVGGDVKCWGGNLYGTLGQELGATVGIGDSPGDMAGLAPIDLGTGRTATAISAGSAHTCALLDDASVKCWGNNGAGALGHGGTNRGEREGDMGDALPTVALGTGRTATAISAGNSFTCALLDDGSVKCWGSNGSHQLGHDGQPDDPQDGYVAALPTVDLGTGRYATAISAGGAHTCALLDDGSVRCWGQNWAPGQGNGGQLGQDSSALQTGEGSSVHIPMAELRPIDLGGRAVQVVTGFYHSCAVLANGTATCWGHGADGRLGTGSTASVGVEPGDMAGLSPIALGNGRTARALAAGTAHTCAALDDGNVKCWGSGEYGQRGSGSTGNVGGSSGQMGNNLSAVSLAGNVTPVVSPPSHPRDVSWDETGAATVSLSWTAPVNNGGAAISGSRIQRSTDEGLTWTTIVENTGSAATTASVTGPAGGDVRYRVAALNAAGLGPWSIQSAPAGLIPLEPGRIVDTRPGGETVDGLFAGIGLRDAGGVLAVDVLGRAGIPDDTGAIILNVAVNDPQAAGYVTVFPCGTPPPNASNLNHEPGQTIANTVIVKLGTNGQVCFFTDQAAHLIVDVNGAYPLDATFNALEPARLLDTRPGGATIDGAHTPGAPLTGGGIVELDVIGRGGVPAGTDAVVLNVTVNEPADAGYVTVYPCGGSPPNASNLNYVADQTIPNNVVVRIGDSGRVCLFSDQTAHLIVDVNGSFPPDGTYDSVAPARLLDTRPGGETADGQSAGDGQLTGGQVLTLQVTGRGGVPARVGAVVLNVTVNEPAGAGYVTVFPCGGNPPNASNINYVAGQTIPNNVIVKTSDTGQVCIFSDQTTHLLADVNGSFPPLS